MNKAIIPVGYKNIPDLYQAQEQKNEKQANGKDVLDQIVISGKRWLNPDL